VAAFLPLDAPHALTVPSWKKIPRPQIYVRHVPIELVRWLKDLALLSVSGEEIR